MSRPYDIYRKRRNTVVTCLSFGRDRRAMFPNHFFCHGCDLFEDAVASGNKRANRSQKKYKCTAGHSQTFTPTSLRPEYCPSLALGARTNDDNDDDSDEDDEDHEHNKTNQQHLVQESLQQISPLKSPVKKKIRGVHSPESLFDAGSPHPRRLFERKEDGGNDDDLLLYDDYECNESLLCADETMAHIMDLEESVVWLKEQVNVLKCQNESLREDLKEAQGKWMMGGRRINWKENDNAERKCRIDEENRAVSDQLFIVIDNFLTTSELLTDRRRFPWRRLGKIVIDSVMAFEWTHSTLEHFARRTQSTNCNDGDNDSFASILTEFMNENLQRRGNSSKAALLVDSLWDDTFLEGEAKVCMIDKVKRYLRNNVFTPQAILKAMDIAGFNLSLAGIEVLRKVESSEKYNRGIIPSKSSILRCARKLEAFADTICPFKMIGRTFTNDPDGDDYDDNSENIGEGFEFDPVKMTDTLLKAFGIMDDARHRPVYLALTSDGAQLTHTISHVAAGLKFIDIAIRDPVTGLPLFLEVFGQSRNLCFPVRIVIAKDDRNTLEGFRRLYEMYSSGEVADALDCQQFKMSFPGDMKLQWGALDDGGAAKVKEKFCYICPCRSSSLHVPQDKTKCPICKNAPDDDEKDCYHYEFLADAEVREKLEEELAVLTAVLDDVMLENFNANIVGNEGSSRMYVRHSGQAMVEGDKLDIDYRPSAPYETAAFSRHINEELAIRSMSIIGPLSDRKQRLREQLKKEQRARELMRELTESVPREKAMYVALQAVVCILHLENRVGLKSIESILRSGLSNALRGVLDCANSNGEKKRQQQYVEHITTIIQTKILGSVVAPSQWRFPLLEDGTMGALSMDNNRTRRVMNDIELLIDASFPDGDENKQRLLRCFPRYRAAIILLRKQTDYSDEEIKYFQEHIDAWFTDWVKVYGKEGCTNYTHMLSSSHVMTYMKEWRCLHRFSQQGWEALNALIKSYFFRRSNRGGLAKNSSKKSKLLGIARWLQRRTMWYSGHGDALFDDNNDDSSYQDASDDGGDDSYDSYEDYDLESKDSSEGSESSY